MNSDSQYEMNPFTAGVYGAPTLQKHPTGSKPHQIIECVWHALVVESKSHLIVTVKQWRQRGKLHLRVSEWCQSAGALYTVAVYGTLSFLYMRLLGGAMLLALAVPVENSQIK